MAGILDGKVAVVTGGGSGIGEAIARMFAAEGAKVVVSGRRPEPIEQVATDISGLAVTADVSSEDSVKALFKACEEAHGRLDILVSNAGITGPVANAEDMNMAEWDETMAINVRGVLLCAKHAVPMLKRQGGSIINLSSRMGLKGYPMRTPYAASKFAVIGITQSIAFEVGADGIRCNALCPGAVHGELMERVIASRSEKEGRPVEDIIKESYTNTAALRKWVEPEEVASTALFLVSDAASAITGESILVDCGRT